MKNKLIFEFSKNKSDGDSSFDGLLGGKGANLAEMSNMGIPVPPGFTITTEVCNYFTENKKLPDNLDKSLTKLKNNIVKAAPEKRGSLENKLRTYIKLNINS